MRKISIILMLIIVVSIAHSAVVINHQRVDENNEHSIEKSGKLYVLCYNPSNDCILYHQNIFKKSFF